MVSCSFDCFSVSIFTFLSIILRIAHLAGGQTTDALDLFEVFDADDPPIACHNGGSLLVDGTCRCPARFAGERCELEPCLNGGVLIKSTPKCSCKFGFEGDRCERATFCYNDGVLDGMGQCHCTANFTGSQCNVQECVNDTWPICRAVENMPTGSLPPVSKPYSRCQNSNFLVDWIFGWNQKCLCWLGWTGMFCDLSIPCVHGEISEENICVCEDGYQGDECDQEQPIAADEITEIMRHTDALTRKNDTISREEVIGRDVPNIDGNSAESQIDKDPVANAGLPTSYIILLAIGAGAIVVASGVAIGLRQYTRMLARRRRVMQSPSPEPELSI